MLSRNDDLIEFVEFPSSRSGGINLEEGMQELSWSSIIRLMTSTQVRDNKDGGCFMPVIMKPRDEWVLSEKRRNRVPSYRNDGNVEAISMVVLDLDQEGALEKARELFSDFEYVVYSTHSYTKDSPDKFRIVIQLDQPIPVEKWTESFKNIIHQVNADGSCGNFSRIYFLPSISNNAGISPYTAHNPGRSMTMRDIEHLGAGRIKDNSNESTNRRGRDFTQGPRGMRHFSGAVKGGGSVPLTASPAYGLRNRAINYSYEDICKRHSKNISDLATNDSRHNFALSVMARETGIAGSRINIYAMVQFIYRAAKEFSSKGLNEGDTPEELPEIIESAFIKYAPEILNEDNPMIADFESYINRVISSAEERSITGRWDFESPAGAISNKIKSPKNPVSELDYSYSGMRERNKGSMKVLVDTGDTLGFSKKVIEDELKRGGEQANINHIGQFIFYCYTGFLTKCVKTLNFSKDIDKIADELSINNSILIPDDFEGDKNKLGVYIKGSFAVASNTAKGNRGWNFEEERDVLNTLSPGIK